MTKNEKIKLLKSFFKSSRIKENTKLFEEGYLDSLTAINLIDFIEKKTKKKILSKKISIKNFSSLNSLTKLF